MPNHGMIFNSLNPPPPHPLITPSQAIATLDIMTRFPHVPAPTLYTFGEPRVGDYDFAKPLIDTNRLVVLDL